MYKAMVSEMNEQHAKDLASLMWDSYREKPDECAACMEVLTEEWERYREKHGRVINWYLQQRQRELEEIHGVCLGVIVWQ